VFLIRIRFPRTRGVFSRFVSMLVGFQKQKNKYGNVVLKTKQKHIGTYAIMCDNGVHVIQAGLRLHNTRFGNESRLTKDLATF